MSVICRLVKPCPGSRLKKGKLVGRADLDREISDLMLPETRSMEHATTANNPSFQRVSSTVHAGHASVMAFPRRRFIVAFVISCIIVLYVRHGQRVQQIRDSLLSSSGSASTGKSYWARIPERYPVKSFAQLPSGKPGSIPAIQHVFAPESDEARRVRVARQEAVRSNFTHAWQGYKTNAWMADEVGPLSGRAKSPFGGWAATLVDSLGPSLSPLTL
jgi:hypothetical protein